MPARMLAACWVPLAVSPTDMTAQCTATASVSDAGLALVLACSPRDAQHAVPLRPARPTASRSAFPKRPNVPSLGSMVHLEQHDHGQPVPPAGAHPSAHAGLSPRHASARQGRAAADLRAGAGHSARWPARVCRRRRWRGQDSAGSGAGGSRIANSHEHLDSRRDGPARLCCPSTSLSRSSRRPGRFRTFSTSSLRTMLARRRKLPLPSSSPRPSDTFSSPGPHPPASLPTLPRATAACKSRTACG